MIGLGLGISLGLSSGGSGGSWTPASASVPIVGWYKSDSGWGGAGTTWNDLSGLANHLTLTGTSAGATQNGRATVSFNGTTDKAVRTAFTKSGSAISVFMAAKTIASGSFQEFASYTNGTEFSELLLNTGSTNVGVFNGAAVAADGDATGWKQIGYTETAGTNTQKLYVGGSSVAQQNGLSSLASGEHFSLGARFDGTLPFQGLIAETLVFAGIVNSTDIANIHTYLQTAWAVS